MSEPTLEEEVTVKLLSKEHLQEFNLRRNAVDQAKLNFYMIAAGYEAWAASLKKTYSLEGPFEVDTRTGQIKESPEVIDNG